MPLDIAPAQIRAWLDDRQFEAIEQVPDEIALCNFRVVYSGMPIHVIKNVAGGPLVVGGQVALGEEVKPTVRALSAFDRRQLKARIREQLTGGPTLYYFLDEHGTNVPFEEFDVVRIERLIYPDGASQDALMSAIFEVAKQLFYLHESIDTMVENVEARR